MLFCCGARNTVAAAKHRLKSCLTPTSSPHCCTQDACDIADADHTQESLENWDKENITALALRNVRQCRCVSADIRSLLSCTLNHAVAPLQGLSQTFIDKSFRGLFPTRKIARELLPLLRPSVEHVACEGPEGKSEKTCDELGEELLVAGRREPPDLAEVR